MPELMAFNLDSVDVRLTVVCLRFFHATAAPLSRTATPDVDRRPSCGSVPSKVSISLFKWPCGYCNTAVQLW